MRNLSSQHSTVSLARTFNAPLARVFSALADPDERMRVIGASRKLRVEYQETDLKIGGRDVYRFGTLGRLQFRGESLYHDIAEGNRIVCTDIVSAGDIRLTIGVTTFEFKAVERRTQVKVTAHIVWLDGADAIEGCDGRYAALLDDLDHYLRSAT